MSARWIALVALVACSPSHPPVAGVDASEVPKTPAGIFRVTSTFDLGAPPPSAGPIFATLEDASDDPDDPGRYLVDRMIAALPAGTLRTVADELEPVLAAYVQGELADIAPRLAPGFVAMARGLERFARHFGTSELWRVELSGATTRVITGLRFDDVDVAFDAVGLADLFAVTTTTLGTGGELAVAEHELPIAYGTLLRLALDHAVIPSIDPGATDLARALADLVDCHRLGDAAAKAIGVGTATLYSAACTSALTAAADQLYTRLAAIDDVPVQLVVSGGAHGLDQDGDGGMDAIEGGGWTGTVAASGLSVPLGAGSFSGTK